ncbi:hypothetical protein HYO65_gp185 [Tenacibaculum phage PTm1]|uniref:Uncharacterized protein n=1 Tax=Tenacibaculum phage PTm1 TaxID=2547425 RepID=A0A5S9HXE6_9CAUD|nr:hypothetical protein HYO65_gp185 [Tenacibaculum phage PTm1]BBI90577.1 hypothetical protein [Tenacibaculum phage PTm1]
MPLITKINNYDGTFVPSTPLSDSATINSTYIKRSQQEEILVKSTNPIYTYTEDTYEARLYSNEMSIVTDIIKVTHSAGATYTFVHDTSDSVRTSYLLTVTSESGKTVTKRRIVPINIGSVSPTLTINTITDGNFYTSKPRYFSEQNVTVSRNTLKVGVIEVTTFNNASQYFNLTIKTSNASSTLTYIAKTTSEPNSLNTHGTTLTAFNTTEDAVLDDNFVYAKVVAGSDIIYFKLVQSGTVSSTTTLDSLKKLMSNKWFYVYNNRTAVKVSDLTGAQVVEAESKTDADLRTWLSGLTKTYHDVSTHLVTLRDLTATQNQQTFIDLKAYNDSNIQSFTQSDVKDMGASIAGELYTIFNALDTATKAGFKHTLNWFQYIRDRKYDHIVSPNVTVSERNRVLSQAKSDFQKEFSHASVLYKYVNDRYLEHFIRKFKYIKGLIDGNNWFMKHLLIKLTLLFRH